jgi:isochorismate synthase
MTRPDPAAVDALRAALARAEELGAPVVVARADPLRSDPLEIFARAAELGEPRFAATCPRAGTTRIGVGEVSALEPRAATREAAPLVRLAADARALLRGARAGPGADLLLVGGLAFDPRLAGAADAAWDGFGPGRLALPEWLVVAGPGGTRLSWLARIAPGDDPVALARHIAQRRARLLAPARAPAPPPRIAAPPDALRTRYAATARELIDAIRSGAAQKVVLADAESLELDGPLDPRLALRALADAHPDCLVFAQGRGDATFLGATPERLVRLAGGRVRASALAGTALPDCDLRSSAKDRAEHAFVVEAIAGALRATCDDVEVPAEPGLCRTGRVAHLQTELGARARPGIDLLELVARLHPTPAVAGTPRDAALELIRKHERFDRGWYAGPIGWTDARGEGEFHVALRCALLRGRELRAFAGAGLVAASDPLREALETRLKLGALREPLEALCAR